MKKKQSYNFGFRGWMLMIYQFIAFFTFTVFTNFPMNILAEDFYGGATLVANVYTYATIATIIIQLIASKFIGKIKNMKNISLILGAVTLAVAVFLMVYPAPMGADPLWLAMFAIETVASILYATFTIGVIAGQWFPRRKGTFMGIATIAFPVTNALIGIFATSVFEMDFEAGAPKLILWLTSGGMAGSNTILTSFLPFFIVALIGWLIGLIFVKDYPEQCGAYRDNDKSITPEVAKAMMEQEIEAKKTTVWTTGHILGTRDFWFITIPAGFLLMFAVGAMTQTSPIFAAVGLSDSYDMIMLGIAAAGIVGSYVLG
ncbi:MAG: hypothetical protein HUJ76_11155, partial [Parasporobacterium sp.]|nr:hypothetical protein [Parasporobacterium sp.]